MPALLSVENWVSFKIVLGGVRDVALIHYPSCTDSIKLSLQCSCNFVVINASEGSLCFQIVSINSVWQHFSAATYFFYLPKGGCYTEVAIVKKGFVLLHFYQKMNMYSISLIITLIKLITLVKEILRYFLECAMSFFYWFDSKKKC
jgi:hypothetical protein